MEIYTVKVAVKPYTKAYLENNYGNPADIRQLSGYRGAENHKGYFLPVWIYTH